MAILRATADGAATLAGVPADPWKDLLRPALLAAVLTAPALLLTPSGTEGTLAVLAGAVVLTPLLLGAVSGDGPWRALSPWRAVRTLRRLGGDGALATLLVGAVWLFARMLAGLVDAPPDVVPPLWRAVLGTVAPLSLFLVPRVLGLLLEARGEEVGYRFRVRGVVPVLPGARPERSQAHRAPDPPSRPPPAPIALEETASARSLELEPLTPEGEREE